MTSSSSSSEEAGFDCQLFVAHGDVSDIEYVAEVYPDKLKEVAAHALIRGIVLRDDVMYEELMYEYDVTPDYNIVLKAALCYGLNDVLIWARDNVELSKEYKKRVSRYLSNLKDPWEVTGTNELWRSLVVEDKKDDDEDDSGDCYDAALYSGTSVGTESRVNVDNGKEKEGNDKGSGKSAWFRLVRKEMEETAQSASEQDDERSITAPTAEGRHIIIPWSDTNVNTPSTDTTGH